MMPHFSQNNARVGIRGMLTVGAAKSSSLFSMVPRDPDGEHFVAVVAARLQVDGFVLPRFGDQSFEVVGHVCLRWGCVVYDHFGGVSQKKTGQETPSSIQGGFERSS